MGLQGRPPPRRLGEGPSGRAREGGSSGKEVEEGDGRPGSRGSAEETGHMTGPVRRNLRSLGKGRPPSLSGPGPFAYPRTWQATVAHPPTVLRSVRRKGPQGAVPLAGADFSAANCVSLCGSRSSLVTGGAQGVACFVCHREGAPQQMGKSLSEPGNLGGAGPAPEEWTPKSTPGSCAAGLRTVSVRLNDGFSVRPNLRPSVPAPPSPPSGG